jgi:hypothetical protein
VIEISDMAFAQCTGFNNLIFNNFNANPQWSGLDVFDGWDSSIGGVVSVTGSYTTTWTSQMALEYAQSKGLSYDWTTT